MLPMKCAAYIDMFKMLLGTCTQSLYLSKSTNTRMQKDTDTKKPLISRSVPL